MAGDTQVMTTPTAPPSPVVMKIDDPSGLEQCDLCVGTGLWRIIFPKGELVFCAHHGVSAGYVSRSASHAAYER